MLISRVYSLHIFFKIIEIQWSHGYTTSRFPRLPRCKLPGIRCPISTHQSDKIFQGYQESTCTTLHFTSTIWLQNVLQNAPLARNVCFQGDQATGLGAVLHTSAYLRWLDTPALGFANSTSQCSTKLHGLFLECHMQVRHTKKNSATKPTAGVLVVISHVRY